MVYTSHIKHTFLKDRCTVHLDNGAIVLVLLVEAHRGCIDLSRKCIQLQWLVVVLWSAACASGSSRNVLKPSQLHPRIAGAAVLRTIESRRDACGVKLATTD